MNLVELDHALRKLRLSGMADVLETRLRQAQAEKLVPLDLVATLVSDEPTTAARPALCPAPQTGGLPRCRPLPRPF